MGSIPRRKNFVADNKKISDLNRLLRNKKGKPSYWLLFNKIKVPIRRYSTEELKLAKNSRIPSVTSFKKPNSRKMIPRRHFHQNLLRMRKKFFYLIQMLIWKRSQNNKFMAKRVWYWDTKFRARISQIYVCLK